jgi:hypothetical protein
MEKVAQEVGYNKRWFVARQVRSGGLALLWTEDVGLTVMSSSKSHIDTVVTLANGVQWRLTGSYGAER